MAQFNWPKFRPELVDPGRGIPLNILVGVKSPFYYQSTFSTDPPPRAAEYPIALRWHSAYYVIDQTAPFIPKDYPNPRIAEFANALRTWTNGPTIAIQVATLPFFQRDWPNPRSTTLSADISTFLQRSPILVQPRPFAQYDWPTPRIIQSPIDLAQSVPSKAILVQPVPFAQYDWRVPMQAGRPDALSTWIQSIFHGSPGTPFAQFDWPLAIPRGYPKEVLFWVSPVATYFVFIFNPVTASTSNVVIIVPQPNQIQR